MLDRPLKDWNDAYIDGLSAREIADAAWTAPARSISRNTSTAADPRTRVFEPIKYAVPGYIPEELTILAGRPKLGKSWLMLEAALAIAVPGSCLGGVACEAGDALYLALEDNERRLQSRITKLIGAYTEWPSRFHYATEWPRADAGGLDRIREWIKAANNPRQVVIDVFAMFRSQRSSKDSPYESDYNAMHDLQAIASDTGVAIVAVHHLRKGVGEGDDPFEKVSGTLGLSGAADTVLVLDRDSNGATLYGRGRDIEEFETAVQFDRATCRWRALGKAADVRLTDERSAILRALKEDGGEMSPADIATATGMPSLNVRQLLLKLGKAGEVIKVGYGRYQHPDNTSSPITPITPITLHEGSE